MIIIVNEVQFVLYCFLSQSSQVFELQSRVEETTEEVCNLLILKI